MLRVLIFILGFLSFFHVATAYCFDSSQPPSARVLEKACLSDIKQCDRMILGILQGMEMSWTLFAEYHHNRPHIFCFHGDVNYLVDIRQAFLKNMKSADYIGSDNISAALVLASGWNKYLCREGGRNLIQLSMSPTLGEFRELCVISEEKCSQVIISFMQGMELSATLMLGGEAEGKRIFCVESHPNYLRKMRSTFLETTQDKEKNFKDSAIFYMKPAFEPYFCPEI